MQEQKPPKHEHEDPLNEEEAHEKKEQSQLKDDLKNVASGMSGLAKTGAKEGSKLFKKGLVGGKKLFNKAKESAKEAKLKYDLKKDAEGASVVVDADIEDEKKD